MFKSYPLIVLITVAGLSSTAYSAAPTENLGHNVSNAYAQLIQAEHQLLNSELALEATKSAKSEGLLADGHVSWLENRQQKLVVDILKAELVAYEQFESQVTETLADGGIEFKSNFGSVKTDSVEARQAAMQKLQQELTSLRQAEAKLAHGIATLPASDPWVAGDRLRHAVTGHQANVVVAKIVLLERMNKVQNETNESSGIVSATEQGSTFNAGWKRPSKDSSSMKLMIAQAELQIQLSQHHLLNDTQRLTDLQELTAQGMATHESVIESQKKVDAIKELLNEQQENLSWLKKDLDVTADSDRFDTSVQTMPVSVENTVSNDSSMADLSGLRSVLNDFELGQANYLKREAALKGDMYRESLSRLQHAVAVQQNQAQYNGTSNQFSDVLIRGQQREMEQYQWKIQKTDLQQKLADAEIALLKQSGGSSLDSVNTLVSARISSSFPATLPSRFLSSDPFGLQTTYSAFAFNSPTFRARRPSSLATGAGLSSVFRPVINRNALSLYLDVRQSQLRNFSRYNSGFRSFSGSGLNFGRNRSPFSNSFNFNSFGRTNQLNISTGIGR